MNSNTQLSMYVHPDKNRDQKDKAEIAFEGMLN